MYVCIEAYNVITLRTTAHRTECTTLLDTDPTAESHPAGRPFFNVVHPEAINTITSARSLSSNGSGNQPSQAWSMTVNQLPLSIRDLVLVMRGLEPICE